MAIQCCGRTLRGTRCQLDSDSVYASNARIAEAAETLANGQKYCREEKESGGEEEEEGVEVIGTRTREEELVELRKAAIDVDVEVTAATAAPTPTPIALREKRSKRLFDDRTSKRPRTDASTWGAPTKKVKLEKSQPSHDTCVEVNKIHE